jgi:fatty acid desaturase
MAFMIPYMVICISMMATDAFDGLIGEPAGWVLAAAVSAPVIGQIWATLALMRESDEFVRAMTAKQFIVAAGIAMAVAVFWGFGETFADAPHLPAWLVYAVFWAAFGMAAPLIRSSR